MSYSIHDLYDEIKSDDLDDFTNKLLKISRGDKVNDFVNYLIYKLAEDQGLNYLEKILGLCSYDKDIPVIIIRGENGRVEVQGSIPDCVELKLKNDCEKQL